MLFGYDLNHLFLFPLQDNDARKHFLIGCLVYLAGFIIPIVPWIAAAGYCAILIRQVLNDEKPHLVPWDNWELLLRDGARLLGIRLIYALPLLVLMLPMFFIFVVTPLFPIFMQNNNSQEVGTAYVLLMLLSLGLMFLVMPISLVVGLIAPAAEIHMIAKDDFGAGFRVQEWWPIFKKNWGGFAVALAILYGITMVVSIAMQFLIFSLVFICLLPVLIGGLSMYSAIVQYTAFAQAYREGRQKLLLEAPPA